MICQLLLYEPKRIACHNVALLTLTTRSNNNSVAELSGIQILLISPKQQIQKIQKKQTDIQYTHKEITFTWSLTEKGNFLLVICSNLGPIFPRFTYTAGFLLKTATSRLFHSNFWGVPLLLDFRCWGS